MGVAVSASSGYYGCPIFIGLWSYVLDMAILSYIFLQISTATLEANLGHQISDEAQSTSNAFIRPRLKSSFDKGVSWTRERYIEEEAKLLVEEDRASLLTRDRDNAQQG